MMEILYKMLIMLMLPVFRDEGNEPSVKSPESEMKPSTSFQRSLVSSRSQLIRRHSWLPRKRLRWQLDIQPQAPTHILIIPKDKDGLTGLAAAEERHCEILGRLLYTAKLVAKQEGLGDGYRIVINDGPNGCQSVYHIHVHLLRWTPDELASWLRSYPLKFPYRVAAS
ncbi:unnamed protein product [Rhodiola kirilowii]